MTDLCQILRTVRDSEQALADAFILMARRHGGDHFIRIGCMVFFSWSRNHVSKIDQLLAEKEANFTPELLPISETKLPTPELYSRQTQLELEEMLPLANRVRAHWTMLAQIARHSNASELVPLTIGLRSDTDRQMDWLKSALTTLAPKAANTSPI